jgi:hypothetical protein
LEDKQSVLSLPFSTAPQDYSTNDALIVDSLQKLSWDNQNRVYHHDMHKVIDAIDEKTEFAASSWAKMQEQLAALLQTTNSTFPRQVIHMAEEKDSEYANERPNFLCRLFKSG